MPKPVFEVLIGTLGVGFLIFFCVTMLPLLIVNPDIIGAFAAGFVNPFASGFSIDTIVCGLILFVWIFHDRTAHGIRHGWVAIPVSLVPGVATGFAVYLILRTRQLSSKQV